MKKIVLISVLALMAGAISALKKNYKSGIIESDLEICSDCHEYMKLSEPEKHEARMLAAQALIFASSEANKSFIVRTANWARIGAALFVAPLTAFFYNVRCLYRGFTNYDAKERLKRARIIYAFLHNNYYLGRQ